MNQPLLLTALTVQDTGAARFAAGKPTGPLGPWVEQVWYSEGPLHSLTERVLPSATGDLVLNLGEPMWRLDMGAPQRITGGTVSGLFTRPLVLGHPVIHRAVGARLTPFALRAIFGVPGGALNDDVVDLEHLCGAAAHEVTERCADAKSPMAALHTFVQWLAERLRRGGRPPDAVAFWAAAQIAVKRGSEPIGTLCARSGYGATRFIDRFKDELGVSPKGYARLVRFRCALDRLAPGVSLAELAGDLGYADQSHMGADFRRFAGRSPQEVLAARYPSGLTLAD